MIAARSWSSDITDILLEGEHIDLDIQENVRIQTQVESYMSSWWLAVCGAYVRTHVCIVRTNCNGSCNV